MDVAGARCARAAQAVWCAHCSERLRASDGDQRMNTRYFDGLSGPEEVVPKLVQKVRTVDEKVVAFVRERPVVSLVAALAAGYLVGRVISRFG
jgi:hypothetical protein